MDRADSMRSFAAIAIAVCCAACSHPKNSAELAGKYSASYEQAAEILELDANGAYSQTVTIKNTGKTSSAKGTWKYDSSLGDIAFDQNFLIVLDSFNRLIPDFDQKKRTGLVVEPVESFFGRMHLGGSPGIDYRHD